MDTIETRGSAINENILEQIEHAQETRGVIVFTDPDFSGEKIRKTIMEVIPDAQHAFLSRRMAHRKSAGQVLGWSTPAMKRSSTRAQGGHPAEGDQPKIAGQTLLDYGLIAGAQARERRERLGMS